MKKAIPYWQMGGFIFTALFGTLLHFLFDWTGGNVVAALFSAVNESIWEHLKLLFYPMLAVAIIQYFFWGKQATGFWCIKSMGIISGLGLIVAVYYTYTGIFGVNADWFNITLFFLAAATGYWQETKLFQKDFSCKCSPKVAIGFLCFLVLAFTLLTFVPIHIPLFQDPLTKTYGYLW